MDSQEIDKWIVGEISPEFIFETQPQIILLQTHYVMAQLPGVVFSAGKAGRKEKKRTASSKVDGLAAVVMGALLEDQKDQVRDRLSWRKSINVVAKSQRQLDGTRSIVLFEKALPIAVEVASVLPVTSCVGKKPVGSSPVLVATGGF